MTEVLQIPGRSVGGCHAPNPKWLKSKQNQKHTKWQEHTSNATYASKNDHSA